jgi:hypothetical protein
MSARFVAAITFDIYKKGKPVLIIVFKQGINKTKRKKKKERVKKKRKNGNLDSLITAEAIKLIKQLQHSSLHFTISTHLTVISRNISISNELMLGNKHN